MALFLRRLQAAVIGAGVRATGTRRHSPTIYRAQCRGIREEKEPSSINSGLMGVHFHSIFIRGDPLPPLLSRLSTAIDVARVRAAHGSFSLHARCRTQNHSDGEKSEPSSINSGLAGVHFHSISFGGGAPPSFESAFKAIDVAGVRAAHGSFSLHARCRTQNHSDREKSEPSSINSGLMGCALSP